MSGPAAILIGPPGAGKSTVGPLLAGLLRVTFLDTDSDIEAVAGKPVGDIFIEDGEPAFRALEREAVARAITVHPGGQQVVYLETGFAAAAKRVGLDRARPLLLGNPRAQLKALLEQRLPIYAELAWITVGTDSRSAAEVADEIARQFDSADARG